MSKNQYFIPDYVDFWFDFIERQFIIIMLPSNTEKKNLIESMKKLAYQISNNAEKQKQIYDSLAASDLNKVVNNLYDDNQYLRRISALLLCELFYNNPNLKSAMTQKLCLPLSNGRICFNRIPDSAQKTPSDVRKCLELMKSPLRKGSTKDNAGQEGMFCWAINLDKKHIQLQFFEFKKYSSFTFLDPLRTVFGITHIQSEIQHEIPESPATQHVQFSTKQQKRESSQDSKFGTQTQRKYSITKKMQIVRPTTGTITSRQKQYIANSKEKSIGYLKIATQSSSLSHPRTYGFANTYITPAAKPKAGTTIQSISQYARSSYGRQNTDRNKQKERFSISYQHEPGYQTDRVGIGRLDSRRSSQIQSSINSRSNSKNHQHHHENFYKRVQQILRK